MMQRLKQISLSINPLFIFNLSTCNQSILCFRHFLHDFSSEKVKKNTAVFHMAPSNQPSDSISDCLDNDFELSNGKLTVNGVPLLTQVPTNVSFKPFSFNSSDAPLPLLRRVSARSHKGGFLGFKQDQPSDRLVNSLGTFKQREFVSIFRFKTWWSTMWVGKSGSDLQMETQWVLLNVPENKSYVLILPLIEGSFRSALYPGTESSVLICAESGSTQVKDSSFDSLAYIHVSDNPYNLMKEAFSAVRVHLNTFKLLEEKQVPNLADKFGWCTWDAFYLTVDPAGVFHGLNDFVAGGLSPRFVIIDDGWQSISFDGEDSGQDAKNLVLGGTQMTGRLHRFEENDKFRNYKRGSFLGPKPPSFDPKRPKMLISKAIEIEQAEKDRDKAIRSGVSDSSEFESKIRKLKQELNEMFGVGESEEQSSRLSHGNCSCENDQSFGMKGFARDLRTKFKGLDDIYVWHALCGAWGGVRPNSTHLSSKITPCKLSPGLDGTMTDLAVVKIVEGGIGLVRPDQAEDFFDSMHSYLSKVGITGVKVDVIQCLEYVCEEYGGRVEVAKAYYYGLSKSLSKNFNGTGLISSMQQCNDFFFLGTKQISMGRVGDDFWFQDPNGDPMGVYWLQGVHMIHCAYNSMWMGQIIRPDWDMFQSDHVCAEFHAGSRAVCGGPVYVSDSVGGHDFDLLKKLVFPDGTVPVCRHYALPTRDSLFRNPLFDNSSLLNIWNLNKYGGVIGAFNCQGAGWDPKEQRIKGYPQCYNPITASLNVNDIEWDQNMETTTLGQSQEFLVHLNRANLLLLATPKSEPIRATIEPSSFELFTVVPIRRLGPSIKFAPIGLANMFNSGGTVWDLEYVEEGGGVAKVKVKGGGSFLAYSSGRPKKCCLNGSEVADYEWFDDGRIVLDLAWVEENGGVSCVDFYF